MSNIHTLNLSGSVSNIERGLARMCANIPTPPPVKQKMLGYQMTALYILASQYNRPGARILEIGTGHGASGYMLAKAVPMAQVISLTINAAECAAARGLWSKHGYHNITPVVATSWDYLEHTPLLLQSDMIFVDGDHNQIARDLAWWERVKPGGLMLFHDYSPVGSPHPSPIVFEELNKFGQRLGREPDVRIVDDTQTGMVGWYK